MVLLARAVTSPYLEYCREQRPLLTASLNDAERERLLSQMWHRQALSAVPFSWGAAARKLSDGVTPQATTHSATLASAVHVQQVALQKAGASSAPPTAPPKKATAPKRAAPPESASTPSAKRVSTLTPGGMQTWSSSWRKRWRRSGGASRYKLAPGCKGVSAPLSQPEELTPRLCALKRTLRDNCN